MSRWQKLTNTGHDLVVLIVLNRHSYWVNQILFWGGSKRKLTLSGSSREQKQRRERNCWATLGQTSRRGMWEALRVELRLGNGHKASIGETEENWWNYLPHWTLDWTTKAGWAQYRDVRTLCCDHLLLPLPESFPYLCHLGFPFHDNSMLQQWSLYSCCLEFICWNLVIDFICEDGAIINEISGSFLNL